MITAADASREPTLQPDEARNIAAAIDRPVLILHGSKDRVRAHRTSVELAKLSAGTLVTLEGSGHAPHARDPVRVNLELRAFAESLTAPRKRPRSWPRALGRKQRALFISSPIGLGHVQRDLAIVRELRRQRPDLEVHWWAQHPVTRVLEEAGEYVHPASHAMASESQHLEEESASHELHAFYAFRRMDEILLANFMAFHDLVSEEPYDLWIGDESWEIDYYLHENPELKRAPYVFLTDVIGFLPVDPEGDPREVELTADYNAEMIEQVERYRRIRDAAVFVGSPDDIVPGTFGPGLPSIRDWTKEHFDFSGYVTGFDPATLGDREALRAELGYRPDEQICIVSVGGSGVGVDLLRRVAAAYPAASRGVSDLRMIVVAGPRIDLAALPAIPGVEYLAYVDRLYRHLAVADLAIVQGGLTTTMELTACGVPFIYVPLRDHFEQNFHVRARLDRYRAGRLMEYDEVVPDNLAAAISHEIGREVDYREVETDGAARAAAQIGALL
jgi:predicted glycosyltransferase